MTPAKPSSKQQSEIDAGPPTLPVPLVIGLTCISCGVFLWVWALMWGNWIRKANPASRVMNFAQVNIIPGALFYLNLPTLMLAMRENDGNELGRMRISLVLWGTVAIVSMIATYTAIFLANRKIGNGGQIGMPTRHKP